MRADTARKAVVYVLLLVVLIVFLFPIYWIILLALKPPGYNFTDPPSFFFPATLEHLIYTFVQPGNNLVNLRASLIIAVLATGLSLLLSIPASYAFSRFEFRGRTHLQFWYLSLLLTPPVIYLIPYYIMMSNIGWVGTYQAIVVIYQTFAIPLTIWLLKSFIDDVPRELDESAMVDGASRLGALVRVVIPASASGVLVTSMFAFVFCWNNLVFALALGSADTTPLTVATFNYFTWTGVTWNYIGAAAFVTMLPPMIIFLALRRYIVKGLTFGTVKG